MHNKNIVPLLLAFLCTPAIAKTLTFTNQSGQALSDVVVTLPASANASVNAGAPAVMDQVNKQFEPQVLLIRQGQQVAFPNSDNIRHHVYSFSPTKPFELKLYSGDSTDPVTFASDGVVVLGCNIHDSMVGYIYVHGKDMHADISDVSGEVSVPADTPSITLWHPHLHVVKSHTQQVALTPGEAPQSIQLTLEAIPEKTKKSATFGQRSFGG